MYGRVKSTHSRVIHKVRRTQHQNPKFSSIKWLPSFDGKCLPIAHINTWLKSGASYSSVKICACELAKNLVNKIVFNLAINIARSSGNFCFTLLCIGMAMYQCIIFHHALCHIININPMAHMYCLRMVGKNSKWLHGQVL